MLQAAAARVPLPTPPDRDQLVILHGIPWEQYVALCEVRESGAVRMAYLDGELEILSPSAPHEIWKTMLARLLEAYAGERRVPMNGLGSTTFREKPKKAGLEPDECYIFGAVEKAVPDLALEVVLTSGIDKREIYRRLGVREVWLFIEGRLYVHELGPKGYALRDRSGLLPELDLVELARVVVETNPYKQTESVEAYRRALRRKPRPPGSNPRGRSSRKAR